MPTLNKSARFPRLNTLRFVPANDVLTTGYNTFPFDRAFFRQQIKTYFQQDTDYAQKVEYSDEITIYLDCLANTIDIYAIDVYGNIVATIASAHSYTHSATGNVDSYYGNQYYTFIKQFFPVDHGLSNGFYHIVVKAIYATDTDPLTNTLFVSECIQTTSRIGGWEKTILFEYSNTINDYNVFWGASGTPNPWAFRVEAYLDIDPASNVVAFEDMTFEVEKLQDTPYRVAELMVGPQGVPPWVLDKVSRILALDTFTIDGVR